MSQDKLLKWFQAHPGQKFTASQLKEHLQLGMSIHPNIRALRNQADQGLLPQLRHEFRVSDDKYNKSTFYWWEEDRVPITDEEWQYFWKTEELATKILLLLRELERLQEQLQNRMDGCLTIRREAFTQYPHKKKIVADLNLIQLKQVRVIL